MIKETVWKIAENTSISYIDGDSKATLRALESAGDAYASISFPEKTLIDLLAVIREILSKMDNDP